MLAGAGVGAAARTRDIGQQVQERVHEVPSRGDARLVRYGAGAIGERFVAAARLEKLLLSAAAARARVAELLLVHDLEHRACIPLTEAHSGLVGHVALLLRLLGAQAAEHRLQLDEEGAHRVSWTPAAANLALPLRVDVAEVAEDVQAYHLLAVQPPAPLGVRGPAPVLKLEGEAYVWRGCRVVAGEIDQEMQRHSHRSDMRDIHLATDHAVPQGKVRVRAWAGIGKRDWLVLKPLQVGQQASPSTREQCSTRHLGGFLSTDRGHGAVGARTAGGSKPVRAG
mmetsp:Transcript_59676/g.159545  ORF Transcript_59676/g.159545 Transcript_59676/m.159545 type:complete len:282 (-) Transcript_59676:35-880(-)